MWSRPMKMNKKTANRTENKVINWNGNKTTWIVWCMCAVNHVQRQQRRCSSIDASTKAKRTWSDSFIIDSHVIIVLRHRTRCSCFHAHLFAQWADRHMVDRDRVCVCARARFALTRSHIIYEHMFYSCWSFAITLTTWSRVKDRHTVPRWHDTNNAHYRMTQVMYDIFFSFFLLLLMYNSKLNWDGGNLCILDKFIKFFATIFFLFNIFRFKFSMREFTALN